MTGPGRDGEHNYQFRKNNFNEVPGIDTHCPSRLLDEDIAFLTKFGLDASLLTEIQNRAEEFDVPAGLVLMANGHMSEREYFNCVAFELGVPFVAKVPPSSAPFFYAPKPSTLKRMAHMVMAPPIDEDACQNLIYVAPDCRQLGDLKKLILANPILAQKIRVTTPAANKDSLLKRAEPSLLNTATNGLRERYAEFSAKRVISVWQAVFLVFCVQGLIVGSIYRPEFVTIGLHLFSSFIYFFCIGIRLIAVVTFGNRNLHSKKNVSYADCDLPDYSILVAMYQEAGQAEDLVAALLKLDWPAERLEIKLVCEQDDKETLSVLKETLSRIKNNIIEVVEVPVDKLRTKPKALNYALPLCSGDIVVIYDAEDRPDPMQLRDAYQAFATGPRELACVQSPLTIHNNTESWLSKLFAAEYSSLFDGLLPMLSRAGAPIPLGGTSNHFKRNILNKIGAWDPYNVTEDADIGIRLARAGYKTKTITLPTYEEAPVHFSIWLKQRTRWFKGWYQTWLVHMRHPLSLMHDLGIKGTLIFHAMITGMALSSLVHPVILYFLYARIDEFTKNGFMAAVSHPLFLLDVTNVVLGYGSFIALTLMTLPLRRLNHLRAALIGLPIYWIFLSMAAWRAVWHLIKRPHQWEKTPHRLKGVPNQKH